jgi:UDP-N-acetylglucosamine 2-epimerase (non-hydrolysing)
LRTFHFIIGTAAELIKVEPVIRRLEQKNQSWQILSTGQARHNLQQQLEDFKIPGSRVKSLLTQTADLERSRQALYWFARALLCGPKRWRPLLGDGSDHVFIVHGDTLSTLIGALAGRRLNIPVAHIEAGLRSTSIWQPFPEEITRRLVSRMASMHFAPSEEARDVLLQSQVHGSVTYTHGNTLRDLALATGPLAPEHGLGTKPLVLVNVHRFENLRSETRWKMMISIVAQVCQNHRVLFVMHPQTKARLESDLQAKSALLSSGAELCERMPFTMFLNLLKRARFLISDGGSNQEECSYLGTPCLLMRTTTERPEGLGKNCLLSGFDPEQVAKFLKNPEAFRTPPENPSQSPSDLITKALVEAGVELAGQSERQ